MITSHSRGHETYFDGRKWLYSDNHKPIDDKRPCIKCSKKPTEKAAQFHPPAGQNSPRHCQHLLSDLRETKLLLP